MTEETVEKNSDPQTTMPPPAQENSPQKPRHRTNWTLWLLVMVFLLGSATALYFLPVIKNRLPVVARWIGENNNFQPDISSLADKVAVMESRLNQQDKLIQTLKIARDTVTQRLDALTKTVPTAAIPELTNRLDTLEKTVRQPKKQTENLSQGARIDMLLGRMSQLEASFIPLSKGLAEAQDARRERSQLKETTSAHSTRLTQLDHRLKTVEAYAARDNSGALLAFRLSNLRRRVISGQAFATEITALENMLSHGSLAQNITLHHSISWLNQHKSGILPADQLQTQFTALIPVIIRAKSSYKNDPWWKKAYNSIKNLVIIRRTKKTNAPDSDNIIINIQQLLARHDLKAALNQINLLPDNMNAPLSAWILQVTKYLQAEDNLDRIERLVADYYLKSPEKKPSSASTEKASSL